VSKFIPLTHPDYKDLWVNVDNIKDFHSIRHTNSKINSVIEWNGSSMFVCETPAQIVALLELPEGDLSLQVKIKDQQVGLEALANSCKAKDRDIERLRSELGAARAEVNSVTYANQAYHDKCVLLSIELEGRKGT